MGLLKLPRGCKATVILDCPSGPPTPAAVGQPLSGDPDAASTVKSWRERWLELPRLILSAPGSAESTTFRWERKLQCAYHCFQGSTEGQRCAEFVIEGAVQ